MQLKFHKAFENSLMSVTCLALPQDQVASSQQEHNYRQSPLGREAHRLENTPEHRFVRRGFAAPFLVEKILFSSYEMEFTEPAAKCKHFLFECYPHNSTFRFNQVKFQRMCWIKALFFWIQSCLNA